MIIGMSEEESEMLDKKTFDDAVFNVQVMLLIIIVLLGAILLAL